MKSCRSNHGFVSKPIWKSIHFLFEIQALFALSFPCMCVLRLRVKRINAIWTSLSFPNIICIIYSSNLVYPLCFHSHFVSKYFRRKSYNQLLYTIFKYSEKAFCHLRFDWGIVCFTSCWNSIWPRRVSNTNTITLNIIGASDRSINMNDWQKKPSQEWKPREKGIKRKEKKKFRKFVTN